MKTSKKFRLSREQPNNLRREPFLCLFWLSTNQTNERQRKTENCSFDSDSFINFTSKLNGSEMTKEGEEIQISFERQRRSAEGAEAGSEITKSVSTLARDFLALSSCRRQASSLSKLSSSVFNLLFARPDTNIFLRHSLPITRDFRIIFFVVKSVAENRFPFSIPAHTLAADKIL